MDNAKKIEELLRELDKQKESYIETLQKAHDLFARNLASSAPQATPSRLDIPTRRTSKGASDLGKPSTPLSGFSSVQDSSNSKTTGEESDDDEDEALYAQTPLETQVFTEDGMRTHLKAHKWDEHGKKILDGVAGNFYRLSQSPLLPSRKGPCEDKSHYTHSQIFDVGPDGSPLLNDQWNTEMEQGRGMALWHAIREINPPSKQRQAVGRITIVREPSPILFGAMHYVLNKSFDADELFRNLVDADLTSASVHRAFSDDIRKQRSFVFNFEYFTLMGKDCHPMEWQLCAGQEDRKPGYIQITRCSSVVALVLNGDPIKEIKNPGRRRRRERGFVYDPFASWQVVNLQCYPDLKASLDIHDSSKHYVNGPEAFMNHLLSEYRDAQFRLNAITRKISRRIRPPLEFMFDSTVRERLLFEDDDYNIVKRYFWTHQTLAMINESIKAMIDAYEYTFTDDIWEGKHKTMWPLLDEDSPRNKYYKNKMAKLKLAFEAEMTNLRKLMDENYDRQKEIIGLREALFAGTSIQESRKSVKSTETTVQQGHNIKLLTLVSIFFLPLTFVTSVFGMENMPNKGAWHAFAYVTVAICLPFFVLIGSLNTHKGMVFWRSRTRAVFSAIGNFFNWVAGREKKEPELISARTFDSQVSANGSFHRSRTKGVDNIESDEPRTREQQRRSMEAGLATSITFAPGTRPPSAPPAPQSRIAEMLMDERKRRLRYNSEDV